MVIEDFVQAMMDKDHEKLAACFAERSRFIDYCPSFSGRHNTFLYGRNSINMYFHNQFKFGGFTMLDPLIMDSRTVNFYVDYNGTMVHAIAEIQSTTGREHFVTGSLIKELVIRPA